MSSRLPEWASDLLQFSERRNKATQVQYRFFLMFVPVRRQADCEGLCWSLYPDKK
jgi:hypothetical protein